MTHKQITPEQYAQEIESLAEIIREELEPEREELTDDQYREELETAIFETVDPHEWVTQSAYMPDVVSASPSDPDNHEWHAYVDDETNSRRVLGAMAFVLMRADLAEELQGDAEEGR